MATATLNEIKIGQSFQTEFFLHLAQWYLSFVLLI